MAGDPIVLGIVSLCSSGARAYGIDIRWNTRIAAKTRDFALAMRSASLFTGTQSSLATQQSSAPVAAPVALTWVDGGLITMRIHFVERIEHLIRFLGSATDPRLLVGFVIAAVLSFLGFRSAWDPSGRRWVPIATGIGILCAQSALYYAGTVDDAFIAFRYARNWAEGLGLSFQSGERVEGFTSFLWTALLALGGKLGLDYELTAKWLGIVCAIGTIPAASRLARVASPGTRAGGFAPLLLALSPLFAAWSVSGMEATLFALVLTWAAVLFVREERTSSRVPWSAVAFGVLVFVRPEGGLFAVIALVILTLESRHGGQRPLAWTATFAGLAVPYWLARWAYFGQFFPNTFYAKAHVGLGPLVTNASLIGDFLLDTGTLVTFLVIVATWTRRWSDRAARFIFFSLAAYLVYVLAVGDVLRLRFFVHVLPLWMVAGAIGLDRVLDPLGAAREGAVGRWLSPSAWIGLALALIVFRQHGRVLEKGEGLGAAYVLVSGQTMREAHIPLGKWLATHAPPGATLAATEMGAVSYYSRLRTIDLFGLTDRPIAQLLRARGGIAAVGDLVLERKPELMVLYGTSHGPKLMWFERRGEELDSLYSLHSFWQDAPEDKGLALLVRRDLVLPNVSPPGDRFRSGSAVPPAPH